jgi:uncharacterized protein (TIGR02099 family)
VSLSKQRAVSATADIALHDVKANLASGLVTELAPDLETNLITTAEPTIAPLELKEVRGRFRGREEHGRFVFSTEGLSFVEKSGLRLEPMTATLTLEGFSAATPPQVTELLAHASRGHLEFDRLDMSVLAGLLQSVPLPDGWRKTLAALNVRGMLESGEGSWEFAREENDTEALWQLTRYSARATVRRASVQAHDAYPGVRGIGGTVSFDETQGTVTLNGRDVVIELPKVFPEALALDTADGNVRWTHKPEGLLIQIDDFRFANADAEGTAKGTWQANGGDGIADLTAQVQRAAAAAVHRYVPHVAGDDVRDWLREGLKSGTASNAKMVLKGDLDHFPFYEGKHGSFVVDAHAANVRMVYDPEWPPIDGIDADLRLENERLTIVAKRGTIFDAALGQTQAVIPDLGADHPHLQVDGSARGPATTYLRFLDESPVGGWIDHMLAGTRATGNGTLALKLNIPLDGEEASKVNGTFSLSGNTIDIPGVPLLTQAQGAVTFTEDDIKADALKFEALGGSGTVTLASRDGGLALTGTRTADLSKLRANASLSLLDRVSGTTPWRLTLNTGGKNRGLHWTLTTPLTGAVIELPEPLGKEADVAASLRIAHDTLSIAAAGKGVSKGTGKEADKEEHWRIDYQSPGGPLAVVAKRVPEGATWKLERVLVNAGETKGLASVVLPSTPGLSIRGTLARLNIDPWHTLYQTWPRGEEAEALTLGDMDVNIGTLNVLGRLLHDVKFSTRKGTDIRGFSLVSREAEGRMTWEDAAAAGTVNGRLKGDFTRLTFLETGELSPWDARFIGETAGGKTNTLLIPGSANPWPEIDFKTERFFYKERNLGQLSLQAEPRGTDWNMKNVVLSNPDGSVMVNGWWRTARQEQRTEINIELQVSDAENFLEHFGVPKSVVASDVRLGGALSWTGAPSDFAFDALGGYLTLNVGRGRFTKIEPGIGRLLGVLSLQALPRRLTLDFRDVFSEGFAFDSITGTTEIDDGVLHTSDLLMNGASAKVKLSGTVDLNKETQDLNVHVQPSLTDSLSVGAAGASVLLLANPVGAAAVGVGALVGQMILGNPFEKLFSYEYTVKGSWEDPAVEKKTREGLRAPPSETLTPGETERTQQEQTR